MINDKKVVATIEARMTSTRLPGKVVLPLAGKPNMTRLIERLKRSTYIDEVVIATTTNATDDVLQELGREIGVEVWRGSEDDVLVRVLDAARQARADIIVEVCGDQPMIDPVEIDGLLETYIEGGYDYATNCLTMTYPMGFEVKIFSTALLSEVNTLTQDVYDHEHVSLYIYSHPEKYKLYNREAPAQLRRPDIRLTLDTKEDYDLINTVYEKLLPTKPDFGVQDVVALFEREPALLEINKDIRQKDPHHQGYLSR